MEQKKGGLHFVRMVEYPKTQNAILYETKVSKNGMAIKLLTVGNHHWSPEDWGTMSLLGLPL